MKRREFLKTGSALPLAIAGSSVAGASPTTDPLPSPKPISFRKGRGEMKITGVRVVSPKPKRPLPSYRPAPGSWSTGGVEVANPMSIYPKYKPQRSLFMADNLGLN